MGLKKSVFYSVLIKCRPSGTKKPVETPLLHLIKLRWSSFSKYKQKKLRTTPGSSLLGGESQKSYQLITNSSSVGQGILLEDDTIIELQMSDILLEENHIHY